MVRWHERVLRAQAVSHDPKAVKRGLVQVRTLKPAADLEDAIRQAAAICFRTRPHPDSPDGNGWTVAWGQELDVRTIAGHGQSTVTSLAVASYLAKYATKGTEASGHASARVTPANRAMYADPAGSHTQRLIDAWHVGHADGRMCGKVTYSLLRRWAHMLGFGGHFLTKARRYSVTFTALRQARITYRRHRDTGPDYAPFERQDEVDTETN
ncbi:MAG TPA: replication initiator [Trebonia sp.]|nr:replication initiator [Trebonia sp.]